jgi:hypothetical protein
MVVVAQHSSGVVLEVESRPAELGPRLPIATPLIVVFESYPGNPECS